MKTKLFLSALVNFFLFSTPVTAIEASDSFDGNLMKVKKSVTYSASSSIRYYKFIKTAALPKGTSYLSKISGKVRLQQSGDYSLSLNSIMIAPRCPTENQVPFLYYDKTFSNYMGPVQYNLAQFILRGTSAAALDYTFPSPIPVSGCIVFIFDGGPLSGTATFTMSADLKLEFDDSASAKHSRNPVLLSSGHEFFPYGKNRAMAYLQPIGFKSELRSIYGNYSNLGTNHSITEFYVAKGGCGTFPKKPFANNVLKYQGSRAALLAHLPVGSTQFHRIEKTTLNGQAGLIQETISHKLEVPVDLEAGDCLISIVYAPKKAKLLSGANFENQVKYFLLPR